MRNACNIFTDPRERDVFFTSFLVVLSGCLGETSAYYSKDKIYPNLYGFVIAPAGSNKSSAKYSKTICMKVHNIILNTEEDEVSDSPSKSKMKKQKVVKLLFIPANSSVARIYEHLDSGVPSSILFETEADTLGDTFKMEWGNFSDIIRKLFHHETISYSRKMDNQYIEIEKARLSIFLSGTVNQIHKIIPNSENGLFSRFIFYMYRSEQVWRSPRPNPDNKGYDEQMEALSDKALEMYHFLNEYPTEVSWTDEQWDKFDETYEARLKDIDLYTEGEDAASIVKRLGMITYRITMILTAVYKYEQLDKKKDITCSDAHFNIALKMTDTFFLHSLSLYNYMSNAKEYKVSKTKQMQLLDSLEPVFTVRDVKAKLDFYGVSQRTMQRVIKMKREKGDLKKIDKSTFEKVLKK